jgi:hypothetical protein
MPHITGFKTDIGPLPAMGLSNNWQRGLHFRKIFEKVLVLLTTCL